MEAVLERPRTTKAAPTFEAVPAAKATPAPKPNDAQLNVRMNRELKQAGDAVFAELGVGPSEVVRMLYEFSVFHKDDPEAVPRALSTETEEDKAARDAEIEAKLAALRASRERIDSMLRDFGYAETPESLKGKTDDEIMDEVYDEKLEEYLNMGREETA